MYYYRGSLNIVMNTEKSALYIFTDSEELAVWPLSGILNRHRYLTKRKSFTN